MRILIADDDDDVAQLIGMSARTLWPAAEITIVGDGQAALSAFTAAPPDLVVLDVAMPLLDGLDVCRRIRATSGVPILMLTVRDGTVDEVRALHLGADDYLTKPFDPLRLLARLQALARRASAAPHSTKGSDTTDFAVGDLTIDFATREVRLKGVGLDLTPTEYVLLEELVRHAGTVVPHQLLLERVWGPEYANDSHYLKVFVSRLRQKLGDDADHPRYIQTQWGTGYRFVPPR